MSMMDCITVIALLNYAGLCFAYRMGWKECVRHHLPGRAGNGQFVKGGK